MLSTYRRTYLVEARRLLVPDAVVSKDVVRHHVEHRQPHSIVSVGACTTRGQRIYLLLLMSTVAARTDVLRLRGGLVLGDTDHTLSPRLHRHARPSWQRQSCPVLQPQRSRATERGLRPLSCCGPSLTRIRRCHQSMRMCCSGT